MGHQRIGTLPDTQPWRELIRIIAEDGSVARIVAQTTKAAHAGLELARNDPGLVLTFYQLCRLVLAARGARLVDDLRGAGILVTDRPGIANLAAAFCDSVDAELLRTGNRTDCGEMGQLAAVEAIVFQLRQRGTTLFGIDPQQLRAAIYELSKPVGFRELTQDFFARFFRRFLGYHLARELALHVGELGLLRDPEAHNEFLDRLAVHCREVAAITNRYAHEWYRKHVGKGTLNRRACKAFVGHCLEKLALEVELRGDGDV
jgi:hypothetical protein